MNEITLDQVANANIQDFINIGHTWTSSAYVRYSKHPQNLLERVTDFNKTLQTLESATSNKGVAKFKAEERELQQFHFNKLRGKILKALSILQERIDKQ